MDNATIILEMLARIQKLEKQVTELQEAFEAKRKNEEVSTFKENYETMSIRATPYRDLEVKKRDTTKYLFGGAVCSKNRLVLAIVKDYVEKHKPSFEELAEAFHPSLQGSIGVVERADMAKMRPDYQVRFFTDEEEILRLKNTCAYVCNQWGILNIPRFISRAKELGYNIQEIK